MSDSNVLIIPGQAPAYLSKYEDSLKGHEVDLLGGIYVANFLPQMSLRGKEFRIRYKGQEMNTRLRAMDIIIVSARPKVSKKYYREAYSGGDGEYVAPDCSSIDGEVPDVENPVSQFCRDCPKNVFGTARVGKGKACADFKRLIVLPIIGGQLSEMPCVLDVPATSMKAPKGHRSKELFLREYVDALQRVNLKYMATVTRIEFTDSEYPQIHFNFARHATEEEFRQALEWSESDEVRDALGGTVVEVEAPKVEAPKVEAPKVEAPKVEAPKVEAPKVEAPKIEEPADDAAVLADLKAMLAGLK